MKVRMYNTFRKILKFDILARITANVGYAFLCVLYFLYRKFLTGKSNMTVEQAYKNLGECSPKPNMYAEAIDKEKEKRKKKDLSIIVPAYNAEATIIECIKSVVCQTTTFDYELIVVNDGSTDKTRALVEGFNNEHIILINQKNRGFSGARNRGIDAAVGNYIMFLDADDYLVGNCIESMMQKIIDEDADIIQGSNYSFFDNSAVKKYTLLKNRVIENDTKQMTDNPGFPWGKIYRRVLFDNLRFPLDVWFEDTIVCMILFRLCTKMVVTDEVVYAYRIHSGGITQKARHSKKCVDHYWVMEYVLKKANELGLLNDKIQYEIVRGHMSTLLYRRISLMEDEVIESAFILAGDMLEKIRPENYTCDDNFITKDIEKAFRTKNYKLWKVASFVV